MAKGKIIQKTGLKRKTGNLYYLDKEMNIRETKMSRGRKAKKKK